MVTSISSNSNYFLLCPLWLQDYFSKFPPPFFELLIAAQAPLHSMPLKSGSQHSHVEFQDVVADVVDVVAGRCGERRAQESLLPPSLN